MFDTLFALISQSAIAGWVNSSAFIWPTLESIHFVSLCVLFGSLLVIDLRLVGFYRVACESTIVTLTRLSFAAFGINLLTGVLFFFGNTYKYVGNPAFEIKMLLIAAAGINALIYRICLRPLVRTERVSATSVCVGALSLGFWAGVIVCGRMITFYAL